MAVVKQMVLAVKRLSVDARPFTYGSTGAAGFDMASCVDIVIPAGETKIVPTGWAVMVPEGFEMQVRPRSGVSVKTDAIVMIGTIDSDYRGEVGIIVKNFGDSPYVITKGDRIAQGVVGPVKQCIFVPMDELSETERGERGFGSTGVS